MADERDLNTYKGPAGGWGALKSVGQSILRETGVVSGVKTMLKANQPDGFDCPGCAWGDPEHGSSFEFCENGVKAVTWEATSKRATPELFARHTLSELLTYSDFDLENQGRLTTPLRYNRDTDRFEAVSWEEAFADIGRQLKALASPNEALFYTSGRASNEAAYLYQLFGRVFGTNNFPDCSNLCHEASGVALTKAIGVGKGTVKLEDFEHAEAIFVFGQNPGTNHPRMLAALKDAAKRGAKVVSFNPLKERGLEKFADPQDKAQMIARGSTPIASHFFAPKLGGDMAAVRGIAKAVFALDYERVRGGGALDRAFLEAHTTGLEDYEKTLEETSWAELEDQSGLTREQMEQAAVIYVQSDRTIITWAMGITQHKHSVDTIREIANLLLLRGNIGKPGAGACPVRGHSNVQGDRTMGITEKPNEMFLQALERYFGFKAPREHGADAVQAIKMMRSGKAKVFVSLGGNFARATPDTLLVEEALRACTLTVNIATKLNRSHLMVGKKAYVLPCLGRTEFDEQEGGRQIISVEDSMSMVHSSGGINPPASPDLKSEPAIVAGIAKATLGSDLVNWDEMIADYDKIRDCISATIPGFKNYNTRVREPRGFYLGNTAAEHRWLTSTGKAEFSSAPLPEETVYQQTRKAKGNAFVLQTLRSHDQYNTTVYSANDRYRGVTGERLVVFMNPKDMERAGLAEDERVDMETISEDGRKREARGFKVVPYDIPEGCLASYYPETNVLVPLYATGTASNTPTSKSIPVVVRKAQGG
ncbi:FdhF/YdeP family oxidoreductase [Pseudovibrio sp. SPO723]|uniref:FdhF/YdeP family oxidoreductase n=1 Tax=Nesiotobacter zosterae TaxID=392721 RepID=UPI0029C22D02|nr:FdhF/YdeP family oxidoreductase [Pseudovibrio sp. SPO723]MDX5592988.1 FdhF/YdeP family oxidoreductase [Pseudovibrio sp. SPO723]